MNSDVFDTKDLVDMCDNKAFNVNLSRLMLENLCDNCLTKYARCDLNLSDHFQLVSDGVTYYDLDSLIQNYLGCGAIDTSSGQPFYDEAGLYYVLAFCPEIDIVPSDCKDLTDQDINNGVSFKMSYESVPELGVPAGCEQVAVRFAICDTCSRGAADCHDEHSSNCDEDSPCDTGTACSGNDADCANKLRDDLADDDSLRISRTL